VRECVTCPLLGPRRYWFDFMPVNSRPLGGRRDAMGCVALSLMFDPSKEVRREAAQCFATILDPAFSPIASWTAMLGHRRGAAATVVSPKGAHALACC
jgi:hypothetical protein